jgi:hypothetical protein
MLGMDLVTRKFERHGIRIQGNPYDDVTSAAPYLHLPTIGHPA